MKWFSRRHLLEYLIKLRDITYQAKSNLITYDMLQEELGVFHPRTQTLEN